MAVRGVAPALRAVLTMDAPEWMTIPEVAAALGVATTTVRQWIWRGYLPAEPRSEPHRSGAPRSWVRRSDVRAFAERHYLGKSRPAWLDEPD